MSAEPGVLLALDYGTVRTGIAVSDPSRTLARPLPHVERANSSDGLATIAGLVVAHHVAMVVVGLPVSLDGREHVQASRTRSFVDRLRKQVTVPVALHDERFTSKMADRTRQQSGTKASRDSLAACHLLTSYMEVQA